MSLVWFSTQLHPIQSGPGEVTQAVKDAIDYGYRHLDCAYVYGNETEVGAGIKAKISDGTVKREDLFITSKIWNTFHSKEMVMIAINETLKNLGVDYLDLYLIHWPMGYQEKRELFPKDENEKFLYSDVDYLETWFAMEQCVSKSFVRSIGVSNFNSKQIERIMKEGKIKPAMVQEGGPLFPKDENDKFLYSKVDYIETWSIMEECVRQGLTKSVGLSNFNKDQIERILSLGSIQPANVQVECHPYLNQTKLINFCKSKGITVTGFGPFGSPDRPWAKSDDPVLMEEPKIKVIAEKYKRTPAQVLIRYQIQRGVICIPKSVTKSRIESNLKVFDFKLSEDDMAMINSLDCNGRGFSLSWINDHPHYPFHTEY